MNTLIYLFIYQNIIDTSDLKRRVHEPLKYFNGVLLNHRIYK